MPNENKREYQWETYPDYPLQIWFYRRDNGGGWGSETAILKLAEDEWALVRDAPENDISDHVTLNDGSDKATAQLKALERLCVLPTLDAAKVALLIRERAEGRLT